VDRKFTLEEMITQILPYRLKTIDRYEFNVFKILHIFQIIFNLI